MLDIDQSLLAVLLVQAISGGGSGWAAFQLWKKLMQWVPAIKAWPADALRVAVLGSCISMSWIAFLLLGWLGVQTIPTTPQAWATNLFAVAATAFTTSQLFHGRLKAKNGG